MVTIPKFSQSEITCGEACWSATGTDCKCSCHGKNHGIWLSGGHVERTHKHNGHLYRLIAVDTYNNIDSLQKEKLEGYGIFRCYDYQGKGKYTHQTYVDQFRYRGDKDSPNFPLISNKPTLAQCQKWAELSEHKNIDKQRWWALNVMILWEIVEKPEPLKHNCGL